MKRIKQAITALLCLLMLLSFLPAAASAVEDEDFGVIDVEEEEGDTDWVDEDELEGDLIDIIEGEDDWQEAPEPIADGARPYGWLLLDLDWAQIEEVGFQFGGQACACYSLAYCRTILDGYAHRMSEYNSGTSEEDAWCQWAWGDYRSENYLFSPDAYEIIYQELCGGNPVVALVWGPRTYHHYVAIVGFENVVKGRELSAFNFRIIDPCAPEPISENMGEIGYDLKPLDDSGLYQIVCDDSSASAGYEAHASSFLSGCTFYPCFRSLKSKQLASIRSLPCSAKTDGDSVRRGSVSAGGRFVAEALVQTGSGVCWYKGKSLSGTEGYVYAGYFGAGTPLFSDLGIENWEAPSQQSPGYPFYIRGRLFAGANVMASVSAAVYTGADLEANPRLLGSEELGGRYFTLEDSSLGADLRFQELGTGSYTYVVSAACRSYYSTNGKTLRWTDCDVTLLSRHFTVGTVNRFSVSYDANGGSGAPSPQTKSRGEDLKLSTKKPVRSGCVFCGWALKRGEAAAYQPGSFYSEDAPAVLYAVWKKAPAKPVISTQPKSVKQTVGEIVNFTVKASGATSYQWYYRRSASGSWIKAGSTGASTATISVRATTARSGFQFRCKLTNAGGSVYSSAARLTVTEKPVVTSSPKDTTAKLGDTVVFTVKASGATGYQWYYKNGSDGAWHKCTSSGCRTASLRVSATTARDGFFFCCRVANDKGAVYSRSAVLTVTR